MRRAALRALFTVLLLPGAAAAQDGRIEGRLERRFEATLSPTKILLIDAQTAEVRSVTVEAEHDSFAFEAVRPGLYHLLAGGVKCYTGTSKDILVRAGAVHRVKLKLRFDRRLCEPITVD
jgi:hypothetical protein